MTQATPVFQEDVTQQVDVVLQDKLEKSNITEQSLSALKAELADIAAIKVEDKKSLALVQGGITKAVNVRNNIVRICKKGREAAIMEQRAWISKEKELVGVVEAMEKPLVALKEAYVAEQERIEREELERKEASIKARFVAIEALGFRRETAIDGDDTYRLGSTVLLVTDISMSDGDRWTNILRSAQVVAEEIAMAEGVRQQEEERVKKEAAELEARRKELEAREAAMNARINEARKNELLALGWELRGSDLYCSIPDPVRPKEHGYLGGQLHEYSEAEWAQELVVAKDFIRERMELDERIAKKAEREQLIASRVKALKEAGWEEMDGRMILMLPEGVAHPESHGLADKTQMDFDAMVSLGNAELARRKAAQEEEEARKKLRTFRYGKMIEAGYASEPDAQGPSAMFTMHFDGKVFSITHQECYALSDEDFNTLLRNAFLEKNRRREVEIEAAKQQAVKQEKERAMQEAKEAREKEEDRQRRMNDAQRWEEWVKAVEKNAPRMASEIGKHAIARVVDGMKKMTPGIINDLSK